jgi:hypothetical protein
MHRPPSQPEFCCPFIDRDDHRCSQRFTLSHLDEAFTYCMHRYRQCPVYQRLMQENDTTRLAQPAAAGPTPEPTETPELHPEPLERAPAQLAETSRPRQIPERFDPPPAWADQRDRAPRWTAPQRVTVRGQTLDPAERDRRDQAQRSVPLAVRC